MSDQTSGPAGTEVAEVLAGMLRTVSAGRLEYATNAPEHTAEILRTEARQDAARWRPDGYTDDYGVFRYPPSPHNFAFPRVPAPAEPAPPEHATESDDDGGNEG